MTAMSDWLENGLIDLIFRGQTLTLPASLNFGLLTASPSDSGGGTEVSGGSYTRVAVVRSLANFAGTQAAASTVASSGTSGVTSNNVVITFAVPTANWGTVTHLGIYDASTAGNLIFWMPLTNSRTINNGDPAHNFPAAAFSLTLA